MTASAMGASVWQNLRTASPGWALPDRALRHRARQIVAAGGLETLLTGARRIADVGAGTGHVAEALLDALPAAHLTLIDPVWTPANPLRTRLSQRHEGRFVVRGGTATHTGLPERSMDTVLIAFVLHHIPAEDQPAALAEARRLLVPGGRLLMFEDTPRTDSEFRRTQRADGLLNAEFGHGPNTYRTPDDWDDLLTSAGFTVTHRRSVDQIGLQVSFRPVPKTFFAANR